MLFELGRGGMGRVYLGRIVGAGGFERMVAIKRAHSELSHGSLSERFMNEARLAAYVHHANVVGTHQAGRDEHGHYLICDYVEGESLAGLMERARGGGKVPASIVARIVLDGLAGLHAAHEAMDPAGTPLHMLHRDVSIDNLLVGRDGVTRLSDFGIAKSVLSPMLTEEGLRHGKLVYFPPEYLRTGPVDRTLDIYAMGVTLWAGLSGKEPWENKEEAQILHAILTEGLPRLSVYAPELPPAFEAVIQRACQRDPALRYQTARQMSVALEQLDQRGVMRIATHVQVAEYVEAAIGAELAARRERVRARRLELAARPQVEEAVHTESRPQVADTSATSVDRFRPEGHEPVPAARQMAAPAPAASLELPTLPVPAERGLVARASLRWAALIAALLLVFATAYALMSSRVRPKDPRSAPTSQRGPTTLSPSPKADYETEALDPLVPASDAEPAADVVVPAETPKPKEESPPSVEAEPPSARTSKRRADEKRRPSKMRPSTVGPVGDDPLPGISTQNPYR